MTTAITFDKSIRYDRASRDWAAYLNGEYIGSFSTHAAAEAALDQVAYDQLADGVALTAAELDGGSDADECAEDVAAAVAAPAGLEAVVCEYCDGTGLIPNGSGTGDQGGGWADTCECQDPEPPAPPPPPTRPGLIVSDGHFWRVEFDRAGGVWLAMITGVGCVGRSRTPLGAQTLCNAYMAGQRGRAAA